MKFLNHSIGFCLLLTLLCYSCASDYLDTAPTNQVSPADLFKDEAYAAYAVSGLEKLMKPLTPLINSMACHSTVKDLSN